MTTSKNPTELERAARHECRALLERVALFPNPSYRELSDSLVILAFSAGAAWATGMDWNAIVAAGAVNDGKKS